MQNRIADIRKHLNMTQAQFGAEIGASRGMIAKYETGLVIPDKSVRLLICNKFNVREEWLETGEGLPYQEGLIPELMNALRQMPNLQSALERALPRLSADDLLHLDAMIENLLSDK